MFQPVPARSRGSSRGAFPSTQGIAMADPRCARPAGLRRPFTRVRALSGALALLVLGGCGGGSAELPERVLVIAVESLSDEQIDRMLADDELPVLGRMIDQGARGTVRAPDPLDPMMLWATAFTGKHAADHQMMGELVTLPSGAKALPPSSMRQAKTMLQVAGDADRVVVGVGLPTTWPAEVHNGALVTSLVTPTRWTNTQEYTYEGSEPLMQIYPVELLADVQPVLHALEDLPREDAARFFRLDETEYGMLYDEPMGSLYRLENPLRDFGLTYQRDRSFIDVTRMLSARYVPDLVAVHLELLEPVQQTYWAFQRPNVYTTPAASRRRFRDTVKTAYQHVDQQIGDLIAMLPENSTVIVIGNRGFGDAPNPNDPDSEQPVPQPVNETTVVLWGHGIERGVDIGTVALADLTPTVLRLLGVHIGSDMTGTVMAGALTDAFEAAHPRRTVASHDEDWDPATRYPTTESAETSAPNDTTAARSETP